MTYVCTVSCSRGCCSCVCCSFCGLICFLLAVVGNHTTKEATVNDKFTLKQLDCHAAMLPCINRIQTQLHYIR